MRRATRLVLLAPLAAAAVDESSCSTCSVITRDVAILGGGASGAHAAVRIREDFGRSVIVVEAQDRLGGHVSTYNDPATSPSTPLDFGVQSYIDYRDARTFFTRMNVSVAAPTRVARNTSYADFSTGAAVPTYVNPNNTAAMARYVELCQQYEGLLLPGYDAFPAAPADIPAELLLPFGEFAAKHGIEAAVPQIFQVTGMGVADMAATLTLYVMQAFGAPMGLALRPGTGLSFVPASRNNSELFGRIAGLLGADVLYSSRVVDAERSANGCGVRLVVRRADGGEVLVRAKRLLVSFEPTLEAMQPLDLDAAERDVFSKWEYSRIYAAVVRHPVLPLGTSVINTRPAAAPANYLVLPEVPFVTRFDHLGAPSDVFRVLMVGREGFGAEDAKAMAVTSLANLMATGVVPNGSAPASALQFAQFADHGPMHLRVPPEELKRGFVQRQYALQGHRSTWYTGGAWSVQFTTILWAYTDSVLPRLLKDL